MLGHKHARVSIKPGHPLWGKTMYVPAMAQGSVECLCAVFRSLGIEAHPTPASDERTRELGAKYTNGDECYPAKVTMGDFVRIIEKHGFDSSKTVFFMATATGPCRFGQYAPYLRKMLREAGFGEIHIFSPTSENGYAGIGEVAKQFVRGAWRALVSGDILRKLLLKTRPYERVPGTADAAFEECLEDVCHTLETACADPGCQLEALVATMERVRDRFRRVPVNLDPDIPLIGVVGEIFCRLNNFSNDDLVRKLEGYGAQAWLSDIAEWIGYTNWEVERKLRLRGRGFSAAMLGSKIRKHFQHADEHALMAPFEHDFGGFEEPPVEEILALADPYLPPNGVLGEMVLSVGKAAWLAKNGADGVIDISPFTCMNGIVSESIYPKLSRDYGGIPIRNFYFDGTQSDLDRDLGIYMELVRSYREKKPWAREQAVCFPQPVA